MKAHQTAPANAEQLNTVVPRRGPTAIVNSTESEWKRRVNDSFSRAAGSYHAHADVQRQVVEKLAAKMQGLPIAQDANVLEIGCGTGLLTQVLREQLSPAQWLATDISAAMLDHCRQQLPDLQGMRFACMDGEWLASGGPFDLVCSSLAIQWFAQPRQSIPRLAQLVRPGGYLCLATLVDGTFREWKDAHQAVGVTETTLEYLDPEQLALLLSGLEGRVEVEPIRRSYPSAQQFVAGLKRLGANTPGLQAPPSNSSTLRNLLRYFRRPEGMQVTYEVAYVLFRRPEQGEAARPDVVTGEPRAL